MQTYEAEAKRRGKRAISTELRAKNWALGAEHWALSRNFTAYCLLPTSFLAFNSQLHFSFSRLPVFSFFRLPAYNPRNASLASLLPLDSSLFPALLFTAYFFPAYFFPAFQLTTTFPIFPSSLFSFSPLPVFLLSCL